MNECKRADPDRTHHTILNTSSGSKRVSLLKSRLKDNKEDLFLRTLFTVISYFGGPLLISLLSTLEIFLSSPGLETNLGLRK